MVGVHSLIFFSLSCNTRWCINFNDYGVLYTWIAVKMFYFMDHWISVPSVVAIWVWKSVIGSTHAMESTLSGLVAPILLGILPEETRRSNCPTRSWIHVLLM